MADKDERDVQKEREAKDQDFVAYGNLLGYRNPMYLPKELKKCLSRGLKLYNRLAEDKRKAESRARTEGCLEASRHFKNYMIRNSPFISEILDPYIEAQEVRLHPTEPINKEGNKR